MINKAISEYIAMSTFIYINMKYHIEEKFMNIFIILSLLLMSRYCIIFVYYSPLIMRLSQVDNEA